MHRLQELVRLHRMGTGKREVARLLKMSPRTELAYRQALDAAGLLEGSSEALPAVEVLLAALSKHKPEKVVPQQVSSVERWADLIEKKVKDGAGPTAIYDYLRLTDEDFTGSLSAIKRACARLRRELGVRPEDVVIPVETPAGEVAQVDFGYVGKLYDPTEGRFRRAWVFVMVLGFSRHLFARIVFDQKATTWLSLHVEAFEELGGAPLVLVPDNLKAAVIRAAFGVDSRTALNRSYRELARHYGFKVDPTPPRAPEKKGKVESAVKYVRRNFFDTRKDERDIDVLNSELDRWRHEIAGMRKHGSTGQRPLEHFEREERDALLELPAKRFEQVLWKDAKVHRDSHIALAGAYYSVPWRFVGRQVMVRATPRLVAIYADDVRIATHERIRGGRRTIEDHLPEGRRDYRKRTRAYWEERADRMGHEVGAYVREVFDADDVLYQLRTVQAIVTHLETFPLERARAAVRRAHFFQSHSYGAIKRILRDALDLEPLPNVAVPSSTWSERPRFARDIRELLQLPLEVTDEPN
ncbi:MAG: IS21 family transposase [Myxococcota bacterium]